MRLCRSIFLLRRRPSLLSLSSLSPYCNLILHLFAVTMTVHFSIPMFVFLCLFVLLLFFLLLMLWRCCCCCVPFCFVAFFSSSFYFNFCFRLVDGLVKGSVNGSTLVNDVAVTAAVCR